MVSFRADTDDHGELRGTTGPGPAQVLLLPESGAFLGATGAASGRGGRGRGGQHAVRGRSHQGADEELHQHIPDGAGRVRPVLPAVRVHHIVRELSVDRGRRLLHLLEVVPVRAVAHRRRE